jgi:hypothetical protein
MTESPLTQPCPVCEQPLPEPLLEASTRLYGAYRALDADRLLDAVARAVRRADTEPLLASDPQRDEHAGQSAVLDALGLTDFAQLAQAYRHYGHFGECRP